MSQVNNFGSHFEFANHLMKVLKDAKELNIDQKLMTKAEKNLMKVKISAVESLFSKYAEKPDKFRHKVLNVFHNMLENIKIYAAEQTKFFEHAKDLVVELERQEFDELKFIENCIDGWYGKAKSGRGSVFTTKIIDKLVEDFETFEKSLEKFVSADIKDDKKLKKSKKPKVGFLAMLKSNKALVKEIARTEKKVIKRGKRDQILKKELTKQLNKRIEINFPFIFAKFIQEEGRIEVLMQRIKKDTKEMIYHILKEYYKIVKHINPLIGLYSNYPEFKKHWSEIDKAIGTHNNLASELNDLVIADWKDEKTIFSKLKEDNGKFHSLISLLRQISKYNMGRVEVPKKK